MAAWSSAAYWCRGPVAARFGELLDPGNAAQTPCRCLHRRDAHSVCTPGCTEVATVADHIVPLRVDDSAPYDEANLQALCAAHHNAKTARAI
jgi:5-methylcytosine-specific restriction endonuclease McrA